MSYSSEIWGSQEIKNIEQVHTSALKRFLNVSVHTSNTLLYGETGRYPLHINQKVKSLKYWFRLLQMQPERLSRQAYNMLERMDERGVRNWVSEIRDLLCKNGYGYVWMYRSVGNVSTFCCIIKERLCDNFKQNWNTKMVDSSNFDCFYSFKNVIKTELFLCDRTFGKHLRNALVKFRLGVSQIHCHRYKFYNNIHLLKCPICNEGQEDEIHVFFICNKYEKLRNIYLPHIYLYNRSYSNMITLISNERFRFSVAKFLYNVFRIRNEIITLKKRKD